jgi:tripartite-type tricarboxylate transporter receptor subunit TctC
MVAIAMGVFVAAPLQSQAAWPDRPLKLIVPFAPGGSNDILARAVATKLADRLGQPVVVDNRGGAGGTIGTEIVARSAPDGHTLLLGSTSLTTNAASGKKLPYDPIKDLQPIGAIASSPFAIVVSPNVKAGNLREFIALARAKPRSISYGTAGVGGMNHLSTELFASAADIQMLHVPYKGISVAFNDLLGGTLDMVVPSLAAAIQQIKSGRMRALAVTGSQRSPLVPELPTASEAGLRGFELEVWFGLLGPAGMPGPVVQRLNSELNRILSQSDFKELLERESASPRPGTPEAFGTLIAAELTRWTRLVKDRNIQVE